MGNTGTQPLENPRRERYCRERAGGKTQRQAMLAAYPSRASWKPETVDKRANELESNGGVKGRLAYLQEQAAKAATITRAEVLSGMGDTFREAHRLVSERHVMQDEKLAGASVRAVSAIGSTLLEALPAEATEDGSAPVFDFGLMLAPPFLECHREVARDEGCELWMCGGRYSAKSSYVSLEMVAGMTAHRDRSGYVAMERQKDMREGVFQQMLWALERLGVRDQWDATVSPLRIVRRETGQVVIFHGCDDPGKTKSVKAPGDTYFAYQWVEEADQLKGMHEVRTVDQSLTRGPQGAPFFRFRTWNPPRSRDSWINREAERRRAAGLAVHESNYLQVPREWIPEQVIRDAEALKAVDEESWLHEWMGDDNGYGAEVFSRAVVREVTDEERIGLKSHIYGVDWGFSQDPWVWVMAGYDAKRRTLYVLDEMHGYGLSNEQTARKASERMAMTRIDGGEVVDDVPDGRTCVEGPEPYAVVVCDSAEPKSVASWRECGVNAYKSPKTGAHDVRNSVRWLQDRTAIVVDPRCEIAAMEIVSYQYVTTPDGDVTGMLPDRDNHSIDALRYACASLIDDRAAV